MSPSPPKKKMKLTDANWLPLATCFDTNACFSPTSYLTVQSSVHFGLPVCRWQPQHAWLAV